ncbi:MAG: DNA-binding domain-containing protein [Pseudomonadota bacterium]
MKLKELQKQFANQIYNPQQNKILGEIKNYKVAVKDRVQIYRNNVFGNFDSVLEMLYPATKKMVGDKYFGYLCTKFHRQYFSQSGNLDEYGKYFYKLINDLKSEHQLFYLKDLARLEWQYHFAYFAQDVADFALEKFQKLKEKDLFKVKFKLHPSCYLLACNYSIYNIWKSSDAKIHLKKNWILVERAKWQTNISELSQAEFLFLKQIKKGENLYQIYQNLNKKYPNFDIGSLMNKYISNGVIASYEL